jgi:hypothetical protein
MADSVNESPLLSRLIQKWHEETSAKEGDAPGFALGIQFIAVRHDALWLEQPIRL